MDEALKDVEKESHGQVEKRAEVLNTDLYLHTIPCDGSKVGLIRDGLFKKDHMSWHSEVWFNSTISTWFFDSKTQSHLTHLTALSQNGNIVIANFNTAKRS